MSSPLVDFSFVYENADDDFKYVYELVSLFLDTLKKGMVKLEHLIRNNADFEDIRFQAHFLKSSAKIVKVAGMYEGFFELENMAREGVARDQMIPILERLIGIYNDAKPELEQEVKKSKKAMKK